MYTGSLLNYMIMLIIILGVIHILGRTTETFIGAPYPQGVTKGLLVDDYPMAPRPGLSNYSYSNAWKLYPVWSVGSYAQQTNNMRYWNMPCNGWTTPADMCGGLYTEKKINVPDLKPPSRCCNRVNYYCSEPN